MRLAVSFTVLVLAACSSKPSATAPSSGGDEPPPGAAGGDDPRCPAADAPCMNEQTRAECLAVAATCDGVIVQLRSCPMHFECGGNGPEETESTEDVSAYAPCAGKACGASCNVCPPDDADCVETAVLIGPVKSLYLTGPKSKAP
ncbi:MAG: hypothetical protein AAF928_01395, partial [Myxococcota bacterium]